jgi:putative restriction endonuclease
MGTESTIAEDPIIEERTSVTRLVERPFRDAAFTKMIQTAYHGTCAMTGLRLINGGGRCEIEAAHIKPVAALGPDSPRNGIALSRTVHWMFDRGIIAIADDGEMLIAKRLMPEQVLRMLNPDMHIRWPEDRSLIPHKIFLKYHREKVFKGG